MLDLVHVVPDLGEVVRPVKVDLYSQLLAGEGRGLWWRHDSGPAESTRIWQKPGRADLKPG